MKAIDKTFVSFALILAAGCSGKISDSGRQTRPKLDDETFEKESVGEQLTGWTEGQLDIHFINTGRGESAFYVLPDGTTMLVDMAGSLLTSEEDEGIPMTDPKPDANTSTADVIVNYINHFTSPASEGSIDYAVLSHFHEDHMGTYRSSLPDGGDGTFKLTSLAEIGTRLPYRHYLDRGYPDYNYPSELTADKYMNVRNFVKWTENANGCYWTGTGEQSNRVIPLTFSTSNPEPDENCFSCAFWLHFGDFDFYTGGDHQYQGRTTVISYYDSEDPITQVMKSVDVAKANHHGTKNSNRATLMEVLRPTVWIANVWRASQPNASTVKDVLSANSSCSIFLTNLAESNVSTFTDSQKASFCSTQGHVVVRVNAEGTKYIVYVLDDSDMNYKIKDAFGPYNCK